MTAATIGGVYMVSDLRPSASEVATESHGSIEAVASREEVERYVATLVPAYEKLAVVSLESAGVRLDVAEHGPSHDLYLALVFASARLHESASTFRDVDGVPDAMRDIHEMYVEAAFAEQRATEDLADAVKDDDQDLIVEAFEASAQSGVDAARATEMLMSRARLVQADTRAFGRLIERLHPRMQRLLERERRIQQEAAAAES